MFEYQTVNGISVPVGILCDWDLAKKIDPPSPEAILQDILRSQKSTEQTEAYLESLIPNDAPPAAQQLSTSVTAIDTNTAEQQPRYRTGTGPFMALDLLLYRSVPIHLYRYDLESFFWILAWFSATYNPVTKTVGHVNDWFGSDMASIGRAKADFLERVDVRTTVCAHAHPEFQDVCIGWIERLGTSLVDPVYEKYQRFNRTFTSKLSNKSFQTEPLAEGGQSVDPETTGEVERPGTQDESDVAAEEKGKEKATDFDLGFLDEMESEQEGTLDDVISDLRKLVDEREAILTYDAFMKCLGLKP